MRYTEGRYVEIDPELIEVSIKKSGLDKTKLSSMLLGKNTSYISQSLSRGSFDVIELKRLCEFLGISVDSCIKKSESPLVVPEQVDKVAELGAKVETCITGIGTMYEEQKKITDLLSQMLVELRALNAKQNRLENALGQLVQNALIDKETQGKIYDNAKEMRSQVDLANGRLRDIIESLKKTK